MRRVDDVTDPAAAAGRRPSGDAFVERFSTALARAPSVAVDPPGRGPAFVCVRWDDASIWDPSRRKKTYRGTLELGEKSWPTWPFLAGDKDERHAAIVNALTRECFGDTGDRGGAAGTRAVALRAIGEVATSQRMLTEHPSCDAGEARSPRRPYDDAEVEGALGAAGLACVERETFDPFAPDEALLKALWIARVA